MKTVAITNIPAPYREKIHENVASHFEGNYSVIYCDAIEADREWSFPSGSYSQITLKKSTITYKNRYIHVNLDIFKHLKHLNPDVIITIGGFNPTFLQAFLWAKMHGRKHIPMTDGWIKSEENLSFLHQLVRKCVYRYSDAYIGASQHSLDLYRSYHCNEKALFQSHLCANNTLFSQNKSSEKQYDLMFSGQFIDRKMPLFFAEVAKKIKLKRGECSVLILGNGPLKRQFIQSLEADDIKIAYPGFVSQEQLPQYYSAAKLFLFPTRQDPWGVVANEACAAGTPVITCNNAGAANDLIQHDKNGLILPLNSDIWADECSRLLSDSPRYQKLSYAAETTVQDYSYENAAKGIINAINFVTSQSS